MHRRINKLKKIRSSGQIELFGAELVVGTMVVICFLFFVLYSGLAGYYKQKLGFVSEQGALFAASYGGNKLDPATESFVADLCKQMQLSISALKVKVKSADLNGTKAVTCEVAGNFPLLFFQGGIFPSLIHSSDSSTAAITNGGQNSHNLTIFGSNNSVTNTQGIIPTGTIFGLFNTFHNVATVGNTAGYGNVNTTGNTFGHLNNSTSGNTFGIGNSNTVGDAPNLDHIGDWSHVTNQPGVDTNGWTNVAK